MRRVVGAISAAVLSMALIGGTALAAPPAWAQGGASGSASTGASASTGTGSSNGTDSSHVAFGRHVSASIQAALAQGGSGTALANAVHQLLLTEHANARGLSVAEAVYAHQASSGQGASPFKDLSQQAPWADAAVAALQRAGVVNGTSSTTFTPDQSVTFAQLATMLARLQAGSGASGTATPAGTPTWAQKAMAWAQAAGVLAGERGLPAPNAPLTRAQAVLMLINAAGLGAQAAGQSATAIDLKGTPPAWAHGALALAIQLGLLQGSNGQLLANQPLTRAQMAVLLARLAVLEAQAAASAGTGTTSSAG